MKFISLVLLSSLVSFANAKGVVFSIMDIPAYGNSYEDMAYPVDALDDGSSIAATQLQKVRAFWDKADSFIGNESDGMISLLPDEYTLVISAYSYKHTFLNAISNGYPGVSRSIVLNNETGDIESLESSHLVFTGVSSDGATAVGYSNSMPYVWTEDGGLSMPSGSSYSNAGKLLDISGNGKIAIGYDRTGVYSYDVESDSKSHLNVPDNSYVTVESINTDGTLVVGNVTDIDTGAKQGVIWNLVDGSYKLVATGDVNIYNPMGIGIELKGIANDGQLIVGGASFVHNFPDHGNNHKLMGKGSAMALIHGVGTVFLQNYLESKYSYDFGGWRLNTANFVSSDGNVIIGSASKSDGFTRPYKIELIRLCEAPGW